jgi:hypothetical protein
VDVAPYLVVVILHTRRRRPNAGRTEELSCDDLKKKKRVAAGSEGEANPMPACMKEPITMVWASRPFDVSDQTETETFVSIEFFKHPSVIARV